MPAAFEQEALRVWVTVGYLNGELSGFRVGPAYEVRNGLRQAGIAAYLVSTDQDLGQLRERHQQDVVFPIEETYPHPGFEHDPVGVRSALESLGLPFVGSSSAAVRRAGNKAAAKIVLREAGLEVPAGICLRDKTGARAEVEAFTRRFPGPWVLKPVTGRGGSIGVEYLPDRHSLQEALELWSSTDSSPVLIEEYVDGIETTAWVMGTEADLRCTQILEIGRSGPIFERSSKTGWSQPIRDGASSAPEGRISRDRAQDIAAAALRAHRALDAYSYSRVDVILRDAQPVVLEANVRPSLGNEGGLSIADGSSISFPQALSALVRHALLRSIPGMPATLRAGDATRSAL